MRKLIWAGLAILGWACGGGEPAPGPATMAGGSSGAGKSGAGGTSKAGSGENGGSAGSLALAGAGAEAGAAAGDTSGGSGGGRAGGSGRGGGGSGGSMTAGGAGDGDAPGGAGAGDRPECVKNADCPELDTIPAHCAEATCVDGACAYAARDADHDGFAAKHCSAPGVTITTGSDCDDGDASINPDGWDGPAGEGHPNACNDGLDQDCSGTIDDGVLSDFTTCTCTPSAVEPCGTLPNGTPIDYPVLDSGGKPVGTCHFGTRQCQPNGTWGTCSGAQGPEPETCDGLNNDCDTETDEDAIDPSRFYCDADADGHLASTTYELACAPSGTCAGEWRSFPDDSPPDTFDDCDDHNPNRYPGNTEICDGIDNDCNGIVDGLSHADDLKQTFYYDADGDGYGTDASKEVVCTQPGPKWVHQGGDCSDDSGADPDAAQIHPGQGEICNGKDDDCDHLLDAQDSPLIDTPSFPGTTVECSGGHWNVTGCPTNLLDCDDNALNGCERDATLRTSCHACTTSCSFACGASDCDELTALAAGLTHACGVSGAGLAWCWGNNANGKLGDSTTSQRDTPTQVSNLTGVTAIAAGYRHTCAIASPSKTLYCWGDDTSGQLSNSTTTTESHTPVTASYNGSSMTNVVSVALGEAHSCAVISGGAVRCWGKNDSGQVGAGSSAAAVPTAAAVLDSGLNPVTDGVQVALGASHSCLLRSDHTVACWGSNTSDQLGNTGSNSKVALAVAGLTGVTQLAAGGDYSCAVAGGKVYCWGANDNEQLGQSGAGPFATPQQVPSLSDAVAVACGFESTCVLRSGGSVECWGGNSDGERGDTGPSASTSRTAVLTSGAAVVAGDGNFNCALKASGAAYCWGNDSSSQLGNASGSTHVPQLLVK